MTGTKRDSETELLKRLYDVLMYCMLSLLRPQLAPTQLTIVSAADHGCRKTNQTGTTNRGFLQDYL